MAKLRTRDTVPAYFWGCTNCNRGGVEFSEAARDHHLNAHRCPRPRLPKAAPEPKK